MTDDSGPKFGSSDLALPEALRGPLRAHLKQLREAYVRRQWAGRVGFGQRPAVIVIDLARYWVDPKQQIGSLLDPIVESTATLLKAARNTGIPIFYTNYARDPAHPP